MIFKGEWFLLALVGMFLICIIDLSKKYILDKNMIKTNELVIYSAILAGLIGVLHFLFGKKCRSPNKFDVNILILLFGLAIAAYLFNLSFIYSISLAPDVSLTGMILSLNIVLVYLFSSFFFTSSPGFNLDVFFGLIMIVGGINIIANNF
jgi:membrane-associated HD superfamily phosphohydrolase